MLKSRNPPPVPYYPQDLNLAAQAKRARAQLYPVTFFYVPWIGLAVGYALWLPRTRVAGLGFFFGLGALR